MISAVVLTRGDRDLDECLRSLNFCDEVIVIKKNNIKDFSAERNSALKKAKNGWILFVDDDEIVSTKLREEILKIDDTYNGFYINRNNVFLGRVVGRDKVLRLGKKNAGNWERMVHEEWKVKGKVGYLNGHLTHKTARNLNEAVLKTNFYSTLHAKQNLQDQKRSNIFKILFLPVAKILQNLITGKGLVFAMLHSFHSFLSWSKIWLLQKNSA